ncbi:hypothetical protein F5Y12DRAFT_772436 [Xylaria sp. FL1777]|nr:hypothetical protein F5Y12DRAFT_772436 [Xylaria sp. FL1777]
MKQKQYKWMAEQDEKARLAATAEAAENARRVQSAMIKLRPDGTPIVPQEDTRVGNAIMLGEEDSVPKYHTYVMQPYAHQYGHSTASIAYEEGFKDGFEKGRQQQEHHRGCKYRYSPGLHSIN